MRQTKLLHTSAFSMLIVISSVPFWGTEGRMGLCVYIFFHLPFLTNMPIEAILTVLCIHCQIQLQFSLSFPNPVSTQPHSTSLFFPGYLSPIPCPVLFLLVFHFGQEVFAEPCWSLLPECSLVEPERFWPLRKMSLKIWQFYSAPFSLSAVFQRVPSSNSLNNWSSGSPKIQGTDFNLSLAHNAWDHEFHRGMITSAQAATDPDLAS